MSRKTIMASAITLVATAGITLVGAYGSGAFAQDELLAADQVEITAETPLTGDNSASDSENTARFVSQEIVQQLPVVEQPAIADTDIAAGEWVPQAESLPQLVHEIQADSGLSEDMQCLAGAIYFESRGEPLRGQLAVGRVIVNRAESRRFPSSYCGVVFQRSQFSFVRGGKMPAINKSSTAWEQAKTIARIAHEGLWESPVKGALFFHAKSVNPGWRLKRLARVSSHIFYR